jgi:hypothetical protein
MIAETVDHPDHPEPWALLTTAHHRDHRDQSHHRTGRADPPQAERHGDVLEGLFRRNHSRQVTWRYRAAAAWEQTELLT